MIPSILARDVISSLEDYISLGFKPSNPPLQQIIDEFLEAEGAFTKGPFLEIALPYKKALLATDPFESFPLDLVPYVHQQESYARLRKEVGRSTLITTGTSSGKTECFMYPILDYCLAHADERGVKAIVIYPMNALADDQAERFASKVWSTSQLKSKVSVGLYTGDSKDERSFMSEHHVIESRYELRQSPPDILLTNYKMLDLLLIRPSDRTLWLDNESTTLRYLVVDELHTFDGAQGTDLACLIRRLKQALNIPKSHLICVGTSATIGSRSNVGESDSNSELVSFAKRIYGEAFDDESIISESRQTFEEFIDSMPIEYTLAGIGGGQNISSPDDFSNFDDYLDYQHDVFFNVPLDRSQSNWDVELGTRLLQHSTFRKFLEFVSTNSIESSSLKDVAEVIEMSLPADLRSSSEDVVVALCSLVSAAKVHVDEHGSSTMPFLRLRLHVWVRELRRMVASITEPPSGREQEDAENGEEAAESEEEARVTQWTPSIRFSDDLKTDEPSVHFPLIQCRECRTTGWAALLAPASSQFSRSLSDFYNVFFSKDAPSRIRLLFPEHAETNSTNGTVISVCTACGHRDAHPVRDCESMPCKKCGERRVVRMLEVPPEQDHEEISSYNCRFCHAKGGMILFGAQVSTQMSVMLSQVYGSTFNQDRKSILFSDNVQDAAHRASFVGARTWRDVLTSSIYDEIPEVGSISLFQLAENMRTPPVGDSDPKEIHKLAVDYICRYIPPDRHFLNDYRYLLEHERLPERESGESLVEIVGRRLQWDVYAHFSFEAQNRRGLEIQGAVSVGLNLDLILDASRVIVRELEEQLDVRGIQLDRVKHTLLYLLRIMRHAGAVTIDSRNLREALKQNRPAFRLSNDIALRNIGPTTPAPTFPTLQRGLDSQFFEYVFRASSLYLRWIQFSLFGDRTGNTGVEKEVLKLILSVLNQSTLIVPFPDADGPGYAIDTTRLTLTRDRPKLLVSPQGGPRIGVPAGEAQHWEDMPVYSRSDASYTPQEDAFSSQQSSLVALYQRTQPSRILPAEHTALVDRETRSIVQDQFSSTSREPWYPNLVSATPTLELGVDIGDLSTVLLCTMPPSPHNYIQRVGRAGRRIGNALALAMASGRAHDLYFYQAPSEMLGASIAVPGLYLNAIAVLKRQIAAFCLNKWIVAYAERATIPNGLGSVLAKFDEHDQTRFPGDFLRYVTDNSFDLTKDFVDMFRSSDITPSTKNSLNLYVSRPTGASSETLQGRLIDVLKSVIDDQRLQGNEVRRRQNEVRQLKELPQDEATTNKIKELQRELIGLRKLQQDIRGKNTLEFLTDEGILPNYAFPESGIKLRSLIHRSTEIESDDQFKTFEYVRPASAALSEFAPERWFYAESRRVQIDRVDVSSTDTIQEWRMCPKCKHMERIDIEDKYTVCPRCGAPEFAGISAKVRMLLLKRVEASSSERMSQILDDREYREPTFFVRDLLTDFHELAERSWATPDHLFALEYFTSVKFRDINFGERDESIGSLTGNYSVKSSIASNGFRICRKCGGVEKKNGRIEHRRQCGTQALEQNIEDCLYLYREFESEAIRVVLPFDELSFDNIQGQSLIAALELGLHELYRGQVAHLHFTYSRVPVDNKQMRMCLILYDTVPGGTGYVRDLIEKRAQFEALLSKSLNALLNCECSNDPELDGCYRCVYHYRRQSELTRTSRRIAIDVVRGLLKHTNKLELHHGPVPYPSSKVPIPEVHIQKLFFKALQELQIDGMPIHVRETFDAGERSWTIRAGIEQSRVYSVRSEVSLGELEGVAVPCKPDLLFTPHPDYEGGPEIAVFLDGFTYHWDTSARDSLVRECLQRSGYVVWSFSYQDLAYINDSIEGEPPDNLVDLMNSGSPLDSNIGHVKSILDQRWGTNGLRLSLQNSSLEMFVHYLCRPDSTSWKNAVFTELLSVIDVKVGEIASDSDLVQAFADMLSASDRQEFDFALPKSVLAGFRCDHTEALTLRVILEPKSLAVEPNPNHMRVAMNLDDQKHRNDDAWRSSWNSALWLWNRLQFLNYASWTTTSGLKEHLYEVLMPLDSVEVAAQDEWSEVGELSIIARELLKTLETNDVPVPTVGFELTSEQGVVVAEAELAWESEKLALLSKEQVSQGFKTHFVNEDWTVVEISNSDWVESILKTSDGTLRSWT